MKSINQLVRLDSYVRLSLLNRTIHINTNTCIHRISSTTHTNQLQRHTYVHNSSIRQFSTADDTTNNVSESKITSILQTSLNPIALSVTDTSGGCGAFFRIVVVSEQFNNISIVKQHKLVNEVLKKQISNIHGLTLVTMTPKQYDIEKQNNPN